ncbi:MAG: TnsD family transposase [Parabacteroides sp.]|nr:TnsD family transposase [Parabacteroides sp.]
MLSFFTDPYPDELLYSAFARYHFYSGNIDLKDTLTELFGKNSVIPSFEIGSHLEFLCKALGGGYSPASLIQEHTIFPFYAPFLPENRKRELVKDITSSDGKGIYTKLGIVAGSICRKDSIYYCPVCAKEEIDILGEAYIHREHQLQGVMVCPHHGRILKKYPLKRHENSRVEYIRLDGSLLDFSDKNIDENIFEGKYREQLLHISQAAYYLLVNNLSQISKADVLLRYKNLLYERGLATNNFRIKQDELYDLIVNYYGTQLLGILESGLDRNDEYNWLKVATRGVTRTVHPLRHILLILFLIGDMDTFFHGIHKTYNPFGKSPWPCLNRAADHYRQDVVTKLTVTADFKTQEPVGTLECDCGYIYSRRGPDRSENDRYRKGRVKAFGLVWENKLKKLLSEHCHSYHEMSRRLGCDIKTIHKFESIFTEGKSSDLDTEKPNQKEQKSFLIEKYREKLLRTVKDYPGLSRTEIRSLCQKEYTFLYRHDREWLFEVLPSGKTQTGSKGYIDWNKRDQEVLSQLQKAYTVLFNSAKLTRISKTSLGKGIGKLSLIEKHLDKLPRCSQFINKVSETKQQFQLRRCKIIISKKQEESLQLTEWRIQREAGIRKEDYELINHKLKSYFN